jgi:DNA polymerase-3 subunit beta
MDVKCNRSALLEAVQIASSIVPTRTPKPILQCAKFEANNNNLTVVATDNEVTLKYTIPQVSINTEGAAVLPADRIVAILRESVDNTILISVTDAVCDIHCQDSFYKIFGHDPEDFPVINTDKAEHGFKIRSEVLKNMISSVTFAAAKESSRYALNGVLWEQKGKKLRMVATDGRRLAQIDGHLNHGGIKEEEHTAIVPVKFMTLLERLLNDGEEEIDILFSGNQIIIQTAMAEIIGTLVQGRYPNYEDVIPKGCEKEVLLKIKDFQSAVRRAALLTNENSRGISMNFHEGELVLTSSAPEAGEAEIKMSVDYHEEEVIIGFNPQFILDMLKVAQAKEVTFLFMNGKMPIIMRSGKSFLYVVMPVMA